MKKRTKEVPIPDLEEIKSEIGRVKYKKRYSATVRSTVYIIVTVAAVGVLIATIFLPVLKIYGSSMLPTLKEGSIAMALRNAKIEKGDVIAFYYNNKILIKRVVALAGSTVDIRDNGSLYVDGEEQDEPYIEEKAFGECDVEFPYKVPDERFFVMGDNRKTSVDSRSSAVGCVADEFIVGKLIFKVWPLDEIGVID